jgi:L-ascorbate metabolism protein UlaG (beta-lactamase superfamily)
MKKVHLMLMAMMGAVMAGTTQGASPDEVLKGIHWYGQGSVKIAMGGKSVYIDPIQLKTKDSASIILLTHSHPDHLSLEDVAKIISPQTVVIAPSDCARQIESRFKMKVKVVKPGTTVTLPGIKIDAVPAYNIVKTKCHPRESQWVGYVISLGGVTIYHAGDTERIPEMKKLTVDIALVPLGQTYTMETVRDAADAVLDVKAKIAIPIHYGQYEGKAEDAQEFARLLKDQVKVVLKEREATVTGF